MSVLNIKDPEAHTLASQVAEVTGESLTKAVTEALRERLALLSASVNPDRARLVARVLEIGRRAASRPILDTRSPDDILGYDEHGIPQA